MSENPIPKPNKTPGATPPTPESSNPATPSTPGFSSPPSSPPSPPTPPTRSARDVVQPSQQPRPTDPPGRDPEPGPEPDPDASTPTQPNRRAQRQQGSKQHSAQPRSARDAVGDSKADRQRARAASAGRTIASSAGGNSDDQRLASDIGGSLADMKNSEGFAAKHKAAQDVAEKGARMVANKKTGGASEKALNTEAGKVTLKVARILVTAQMLLPFLLVGALIMGGVFIFAAVSGSLGSESGIEYALDPDDPLAVKNEYLEAYKNAGSNHDVPWTLLAGIGQVATEHGRYAPSDVADQGSIVDRAPYLAPIGSIARSSSTSGKYSPPSGSNIAVIGDSFAADPAIMNETKKNLTGYTISFDGTVGGRMENVLPKVAPALASAEYLVIQVGVNDMSGNPAEATYRREIAEIMDATSPAKCAVWVNLQVFYGQNYSYLGPRAQRFNAILAEEASTRSWISIADLATATAAVGMRSSDGLHPSALGAVAWADIVTRSLSSCLTARPAAAPAVTAAPAAGTTATSETTPRLTASGQPVKVDARYGTYVCQDGICGPYPLIGEAKGSPLGPLQLKPEFVKKYAFGKSPHDIDDAAELLAAELDRLRDEALSSTSSEYFTGWRNDAEASRQLWSYVLSRAPVVLPSFETPTSCEPGPLAGTQGSAYTWPVLDPVSRGEFGAAADASGSVQVAGMTLSGSGSGVLASGAGSVADVGTATDGPYVVIAHGDGFSTRYSRLASTTVSIGAEVESGAKLGTFSGSFLFQTWVGSSARNPRLYIIDSSTVPIAEEVSLDPQGATLASDAQSGATVDPCTGLRTVSALSSTSASSATSSATSAGLPGSLVMPAAGVIPSQLYDSFGDPRDGGARWHQGIDIIIPVGVPLVAVTDAVVYSNTAGGQICSKTGQPGKGVTLEDSLGNHYYYGHMDTVQVSQGQTVTAGQMIGTSGATGNACVSVPHLHFSINEGTDRVVNPFPVLSGARPLRISDFASSLSSDALSRLSDYATLSGAADFVLAFSSYFGGIIPGDPDAGRFPVNPSGFYGSSSSAPSAPGASGEELAEKFPEVASIIRLYFPPAQWDNAIRIANCESGLDPTRVSEPNRNGTVDYGLFQFNSGVTLQAWLRRTGEDPQNLQKALDPHWSARAAALKVAEDGNWGQWSCAHTPYGKITRGLSIVSSSPKEIESGGSQYDYSWQESGVGDTSVNYRPVA
jgi:murein DD-endopeptidase MepM/ murein hydrolase activator NlpD/lysophospholipase L1-like esterase